MHLYTSHGIIVYAYLLTAQQVIGLHAAYQSNGPSTSKDMHLESNSMLGLGWAQLSIVRACLKTPPIGSEAWDGERKHVSKYAAYRTRYDAQQLYFRLPPPLIKQKLVNIEPNTQLVSLAM